MFARAHVSLSGYWSGVVDYEDPARDPTSFYVLLTDENGVIYGESIEPNTISPDPLPELFASLTGVRTGEHVEFAKTYEAALQAGHTLSFDGIVDQGLTKIEGGWRITDGCGLAGRFVMNRRAEAPEMHSLSLSLWTAR